MMRFGTGGWAMSSELIASFKSLNLYGMASAWPEILGTARMKFLDHETVMFQLLKAEAAQREVRSLAYQLRAARFPAHRDLAGFEFKEASVDKGLVRELHRVIQTCVWTARRGVSATQDPDLHAAGPLQ